MISGYVLVFLSCSPIVGVLLVLVLFNVMFVFFFLFLLLIVLWILLVFTVVFLFYLLFYLAGFSCFSKFCFSLLLSFWKVFLARGS